MRKTVYDFRLAVEHLQEWDSPSVMAFELRDAALALSALKDEGGAILILQQAALNACRFLDCIIEVEVEQ